MKIDTAQGDVRPTPAAYLALVMGAATLVQFAMSALGPLIVSSLGLSATQFGFLWFATFGAAALFTTPAGRAADRFGARSMLIGVFALSAAALVLAGLAWGYAGLLVALAISGVAQALGNPATNRLVASSVPRRRQGLVLGIKQSGVQASQLFAGLVLPGVALLVGWRFAVSAGSIIAVAGLVLTLAIVPRSERSPASRREGRSATDGTVWWLTAYAFLAGTLAQATNVYLPLYAHEELGASVTEAGLVVALVGACGVVGRFAWGHLAGRVQDFRWILAFLAACASAAMVAVVSSGRVGMWLLWLAVAIYGCTFLAANVVVMLAIVRSVRPAAIGRGSGRVSLGLFLGFMTGPLLTGLVVDHRGYTAAWSMLLVVALTLLTLSGLWKHRVATLPSEAPDSEDPVVQAPA